MTAETIPKEMAKNVTEEVAETEIVTMKMAETEEAVAEVTAETVPEEMAENFSDEVAETDIITMKMAETEEVVKSVENFRDFLGGTHPKKIENMVLKLL